MKPSAVAVGVPNVGVLAALTISATCTAMPLVPSKDVTTAVRLPMVVGGVDKFTTN